MCVCVCDFETVAGNGVWRSECLLHHGHTILCFGGYCWLLRCEAWTGVFAVSNTQLHYLSDRGIGDMYSYCVVTDVYHNQNDTHSHKDKEWK